MADDSFISKIIRRFKKVKLVDLDSKSASTVTKILQEVIEKPDSTFTPPISGVVGDDAAIDDDSSKKDGIAVKQYSSHGKVFYHVSFTQNNFVIKKDPITRKFTKEKKGPKTTDFYDERGRLLK